MLKKKYLKTRPVCKVTFSLPVDAVGEAREVKLVGDFNGWSWTEGVLMQATKKEYKTTLELETGRSYEFRYLIDQSTWLNDHAADSYTPSPFYGIDNSVVVLEAGEEIVESPAKKTMAVKAEDNLKKIEGVGPKIETLLKKADILTFEDLAQAKQKLLKDVLAEAGPRFRMHDPSTWPKQAKLAAKGDWDKLKTLQDELKGGRKK